jgi:hypothetical protein
MDVRSRPDALEFRARTNQVLVDWLGEVTIAIHRWPTRDGIAVLLKRTDDGWTPCANALPCDGIYLTQAKDVTLAFSVYIPLDAGGLYRLHLPGAVLATPAIRIGALQREPGFGGSSPRRAPRGLRPSPPPRAMNRSDEPSPLATSSSQPSLWA